MTVIEGTDLIGIVIEIVISETEIVGGMMIDTTEIVIETGTEEAIRGQIGAGTRGMSQTLERRSKIRKKRRRL
jgi:hypothetical protein